MHKKKDTWRIPFVAVSLLISGSLYAEKDKNGCDYSRDFIKHVNIQDSTITSQSWKNSVDPDSDEYTTTHKLTYKNGSMAIIEHKFCNMYNYELSYFSDDNNFKITPKNIGELINEMSQQSVAIKTNFKQPLDETIKIKLIQSNFSETKSFDLNLRVPDTGNKNIEQSISFFIIKNMTTKHIFAIVSLSILLLAQPCNANDNKNNSETVIKLLNQYFSNNIKTYKNTKPTFKLGDFNGDGTEDIAVLFTPTSKPVETTQLKVNMPWVYHSSIKSKTYRKSLVIFQRNSNNWLSDKTRIFIMLDTSGVLETPSFKLLVSHKKDKDYGEHVNMLPVKIAGDLIILPTEAGIDTYIYWDKNTYKLFEPEEIP